MSQEIEIVVKLWPGVGEIRVSPHGPDVAGTARVPLSASDTHDQEANAIRLAETMVREAFSRLRAQTHAIIETRMAAPDDRKIYVIRPVGQMVVGDVPVYFGSLEACSSEVVRRNNPRAFSKKD